MHMYLVSSFATTAALRDQPRAMNMGFQWKYCGSLQLYAPNASHACTETNQTQKLTFLRQMLYPAPIPHKILLGCGIGPGVNVEQWTIDARPPTRTQSAWRFILNTGPWVGLEITTKAPLTQVSVQPSIHPSPAHIPDYRSRALDLGISIKAAFVSYVFGESTTV